MGRSRLGIKQKEKEEWGWVCCNGCFDRESCVERGRTSLNTRIVLYISCHRGELEKY